MSPLLWVPPVALSFILNSWLCVRAKAGGWWWVVFLVASSIPLWAIVARYSTNLVRDALLFDVVAGVFYTAGLWYFTRVVLSPLNIVGVLLAIVGVVLLHL